MDENFKRKENETIKQYKLRLFRNKLEYNLKTQEIADFINAENEQNYNESTYRKWFKAYEEGFLDGKSENITDDKAIKELELKRLAIEKEKVKFRDERNAYNAMVRDQARKESLEDIILRCTTENINKARPLKVNKDIVYINEDKVAIAVLADWHFGAFVDNAFNQFNKDEFYRRVNELTEQIISKGKKNKIQKLIVFNNGDLISGNIHNSIRVTNKENVIEQVQIVSETIANMLQLFAKEFEQVEYYQVVGNHARTQSNKSDSVLEENFENFIKFYLKGRLNSINNIKINDNEYGDDIITVNVFGKLIVGVHGDFDSKKTAENLTLLLRKDIYMVLKSHLHHYTEENVNNTTVIGTGALIGLDSYAKSLRQGSYPEQTMIIFDKNGRCEDYHIQLS